MAEKCRTEAQCEEEETEGGGGCYMLFESASLPSSDAMHRERLLRYVLPGRGTSKDSHDPQSASSQRM